METISPARHSPKWTPRTTIDIKDDPASATIQDILAENTDNICIYSDGSGYEGNIGAAAVLRRNGRTIKTLQYHLGPDSDHTVYEGEVVGMILGAHLLKEACPAKSVSFALDNRAAILTTKSFQSKPGHYLTDIFLSTLDTALNKHNIRKTKIRWTPGHAGIQGNEEADVEAKRAALGKESNHCHLPNRLKRRRGAPKALPRSKLAAKQAAQKEIKNLHAQIFSTSPRYPSTHNIDPTLPSAKFLKLVNDLPK